MSYLSLTDADREAMLEAIGVASIEELFEQVPPGVLLGRADPISRGRPEPGARFGRRAPGR